MVFEATPAIAIVVAVRYWVGGHVVAMSMQIVARHGGVFHVPQ